MLQRWWSENTHPLSAVKQGDALYLRVSDEHATINATYNGADYPHFVFCRLENRHDISTLCTHSQHENTLAVQIPCSKGHGKILTFSASLIHYKKSIDNAIVMTFPQEIETTNLRQANRKVSRLTGKIFDQQHRLVSFVQLMNVSRSGCRVRTETLNLRYPLSTGDSVLLEAVDKTGDEHFIAGKIKNLATGKGFIEYGIACINREATAQIT